MFSTSINQTKELHQSSFFSGISRLVNQTVEKTKELWNRATSLYMNYLDRITNDALKFQPRSIKPIKFSIQDLAKIQEERTKIGGIFTENFHNEMKRANIKTTAVLNTMIITLAVCLMGDYLFPKSPVPAAPFTPLPLAAFFHAYAIFNRLDYTAEDDKKIRETGSYMVTLSKCVQAAEDKKFLEFSENEYPNLELSPSAWGALYDDFQRNQRLD